MNKIIVYIFLINMCCSCIKFDNNIDKLRFFGTKKFDRDMWFASNEYVRGTMIYDFVSSNAPVTGKSFEFVLKNLGNSTGYYEYDLYPAYYIGPKPKGSEAKAYLIAFIIDHESGKVCDIHIHPELD